MKKIVLICLFKKPYEKFIELCKKLGYEVLCVNTVDAALFEVKQIDVEYVLIEPGIPSPFAPEFTDEVLQNMPPSFPIQKDSLDFWGIAFWKTQLQKCKNFTSFLLLTEQQKRDVLPLLQGEEVAWSLSVPQEANDLFSSMMAHSWTISYEG